MKHAHRLALFLLALAILPVATTTAQEEIYVSPGTSWAGGASFGGPLGASVMGEMLMGLDADIREDARPSASALYGVWTAPAARACSSRGGSVSASRRPRHKRP